MFGPTQYFMTQLPKMSILADFLSFVKISAFKGYRQNNLYLGCSFSQGSEIFAVGRSDVGSNLVFYDPTTKNVYFGRFFKFCENFSFKGYRQNSLYLGCSSISMSQSRIKSGCSSQSRRQTPTRTNTTISRDGQAIWKHLGQFSGTHQQFNEA